MGKHVSWPEGWKVVTAPLPKRLRGLTFFNERVTIIDTELHPWQHRATLVHESIHAHSGPVPGWMRNREEDRVDHETARRLISLSDLVEVLQMTPDAALAAAWLEVPEALMWARLQGLRPSERAEVKQALDDATHVA